MDITLVKSWQEDCTFIAAQASPCGGYLAVICERDSGDDVTIWDLNTWSANVQKVKQAPAFVGNEWRGSCFLGREYEEHYYPWLSTPVHIYGGSGAPVHLQDDHNAVHDACFKGPDLVFGICTCATQATLYPVPSIARSWDARTGEKYLEIELAKWAEDESLAKLVQTSPLAMSSDNQAAVLLNNRLTVFTLTPFRRYAPGEFDSPRSWKPPKSTTVEGGRHINKLKWCGPKRLLALSYKHMGPLDYKLTSYRVGRNIGVDWETDDSGEYLLHADNMSVSSQKDKVLLISKSRHLCCVSTQTGKELWRVNVGHNHIYGWSSCGRWVAVRGDWQTVVILDTATRIEVARIEVAAKCQDAFWVPRGKSVDGEPLPQRFACIDCSAEIWIYEVR